MAGKGKEPPPAEPAVIIGGPEATVPAVPAAPAPKMVTVKHGGKEYALPEEAAQAWEARDREYSQNFSRQGEELGQLRAWRRQVESTVQPAKPQEPDINTLWFENPAKAQELIEQRIVERVTRSYQSDQATKRFFDGFYRANSDLQEDEWVVNTVFQDHFSELADLPISRAQEKLGELTRERILKLTRKTKSSDEPSRSKQTLVESASGDRTPRPAANPEDGLPKSMGDHIRAMAAARREAQKKRTASAKGA